MGRISASLSSFELTLLNRLATANANVALANLRLSSGHKITSPSDDPSAFVMLNQLQSQWSGVTSALGNVTAASNVVSQAQLVLDQIRTRVNTIRTAALADQNSTLDPATRAANQAKIDAAVAQINVLAGTTINGRRILDGSADFTYTGVNNSQIASVSATSLGYKTSATMSGGVTTAATQAQLVHTESTGLLTADATFSVTGARGQFSLSVSNGDSLSSVADKINAQSDLTGVAASVVGNDLKVTSVDYGTQASVAVSVTSGTFAVTGGSGNGTATGIDGVATINGQSVHGIGNTFYVNQSGFQFSVQFQGGFSGAFSTVTVSGQGLQFALSPDLSQLSTLAIPGLQASRLGGASGTLAQLATSGSLAGLGANAPMAVRVADEALAQLTVIEGRVDGFADTTISASQGLLTGMQSNLADSIRAIDQVDPAEELVRLKQNQLLGEFALEGLAIVNQQRASILSLIQQAAQFDFRN